MLNLLRLGKRIIERIACDLLNPIKVFSLCALWNVKRRNGVRFFGKTIIRTYLGGQIDIGEKVIFNSRIKSNLVGLTGPTILCASNGGRIEIGDESGLSSVVINARKLVKVGSHVNIGGNVRIFDHNFHPLSWQDRRRPENVAKTRMESVVVGNDAFIGTNVIILKGTQIGDRSIVAAGSVVFGLKVPPDSLVKGNPAVVVRSLLKDENSNE